MFVRPTPRAPSRGEKANKVGHVAAADNQPAAITRVAHQLRDPADRLLFDRTRDRGERPSANIRVDRRSEEFAERANGRRRRGNIAPKARMTIQKRMIEQQLSCLL